MWNAVEFFKRMEEVDEGVAKHLDDEHRTRCELTNASRKEKQNYPNGSKDSFKRPAGFSTGLHSVWEGPCEVPRRQDLISLVYERGNLRRYMRIR